MSSTRFAALFSAACKCSASVIAVAALPAHAQNDQTEARDWDPGEIVVTATRREQTTVDVPLAVTAASGEQLRSAQVVSVQDLSKIDSGLSAQSFGPGAQILIIRGISSNTGPTVGTYLDEIPLSGAFNNDIRGDSSPGLNLVDIERVEVLKGPQGTLFGAGSMTGTVRYIAAKPRTDAFEGFAEGSIASVKSGNALYGASAMLNVPIAKDIAALRVVGWADEDGGYIDHLRPNGDINKNVNDQKVRGFRAQLLVKPTERLSIIGGYNYQDIDVDGIMWWEGDSPNTSPFSWYNNFPVGASWRDVPRGPYLVDTPTIELYRDRYRMYSLTANYEADFGTFMAAYSDTTKNGDAPFDSTGTAYGFGLNQITSYVNIVRYDDWTAEGRFSSSFDGPFQVVVGAFYQKSRSSYTGTAVITDPGSGLPACYTSIECRANGLQEPGFGNSVVMFSAEDIHKVKQHAFYGQVDYALTDKLTATAGVRYFKAKTEDTNISYQDIAPDFFAGIITTPYVTGQLDGSGKKWTYNFSLLYKVQPDVSFYARVASGFRLGGVNVQKSIAENLDPTLIGVIPATYAPDRLTSYELGFKASVLDRLLSLEGAVYKIDWPEQQVSAQAAGAFGFIANASKVKTEGFELSATVRPSRGLSFAGGVVYTNSRLASDLPPEAAAGGTVGFKGDHLPFVPKWSASFQAKYEAPISDNVEGYGQFGLNYRDGVASAFNPLDDRYVTAGSYALLDAQIGLRLGGLDASVFARNLTNEAAKMGLYFSPDGKRFYSPPPRTIGLKLRYDF